MAMFPTHDAIGPGDLAALVEERGHGSLWFPEHTHIPASRDSPFPGGGEMPRRYAHTYDLFVAMTAAAVATRRLRIASGICLIIERDPITTGGCGCWTGLGNDQIRSKSTCSPWKLASV